jgi:hypothetical protein
VGVGIRRPGADAPGYIIPPLRGFRDRLSDEEMALIDLKLVLIQKIREIRQRDALTQNDLARLIKTSQSRVAMIENAASDVSLDMIGQVPQPPEQSTATTS